MALLPVGMSGERPVGVRSLLRWAVVTAFEAAWAQMQDRRLQGTTSIGALMEILNEDMVEELNGARIGLEKV